MAPMLGGWWMSGLVLVAGAGPYEGHRVVRTYPQTDAQVRAVLALADDVWTERVGGGPIDVRLSPLSMPQLDVSGIDYEVRVADLQQVVAEEEARLDSLTRPPAQGVAWLSDFRDLAEIEAYTDQLAADFPGLVTVENLGASLEGRPIRGIRIGAAAENKNAMLLSGTVHAREWLSPMTVMCIADTLAGGYATDPALAAILDRTDVWVVPVVNPDGYVLSWNGQRYWRKNTRDGVGVDLNRNWETGWGGPGSSADPNAQDYRGSEPFSEPESVVLRDFVDAHPELVAQVDFHAFGNLILYPWSYTYDPAPQEVALADMAGELATQMLGVHGASYTPLQGADLYPASGVIEDWTYAERGLQGFAIELRGDDFVVSPDLIAPTCEESFAAVQWLAQWAADQSDAGTDPTGTSSGDGGSSSGGGPSGTTGVAADDTAGDSAGAGTTTGTPGPGETSGGGTDAGDTTTGEAADGDGDGGCACRATPGRGHGRWLGPMVLLLIGGLATRRRRWQHR
jgi:MYXO-CTERM domain-containing protein